MMALPAPVHSDLTDPTSQQCSAQLDGARPYTSRVLAETKLTDCETIWSQTQADAGARAEPRQMPRALRASAWRVPGLTFHADPLRVAAADSREASHGQAQPAPPGPINCSNHSQERRLGGRLFWSSGRDSGCPALLRPHTFPAMR
jgi:hypothetical protein